MGPFLASHSGQGSGAAAVGVPMGGTGLRPIDLSGTLRGLNMGRCIEEPSVCICCGLSCFQLSILATGRFGYSIRVLFHGRIQMEHRPWQLWLLLASTTRRDFAVLTFFVTLSDVDSDSWEVGSRR